MQSGKTSNQFIYKTADLNADELKIEAIIKERKIEWLCHYTPRENLERIKKEGLKLRDPAVMTLTEEPRADDSTNICLTISEPNYKELFNKNYEGHDLVLLLIDPNILYFKKCLFYAHNPVVEPYYLQPPRLLKTAQSLEDMFADRVMFQDDTELDEYELIRQSSTASYLPTSDLAEVQVEEPIPAKHILHICEGEIPTSYDAIRADFDNANLLKLQMLGAGKFHHLFKANRDHGIEEEREPISKPRKQNSVGKWVYITIIVIGVAIVGVLLVK